MSKPTARASASTANTSTTTEDTKPRASAGHVVAPGQSLAGRNGILSAGDTVKASDLANYKDKTGEREFDRQFKAGVIVKSSRKTAEPERTEGENNSGRTTASAAQVIAAANGDEGAQKVVEAANSGDQAALAEANGQKPDGEA